MRFGFIRNKTELTRYCSVSLWLQEVDLIREQVQKLISMPMWMCLLPVNIIVTHISFMSYMSFTSCCPLNLPHFIKCMLQYKNAILYSIKISFITYFTHYYMKWKLYALLYISCMASVWDVWKWLQILWLFRRDCNTKWRRSQNCRSSGTSLKRTMRRWTRRIWSSKKQPHAP